MKNQPSELIEALSLTLSEPILDGFSDLSKNKQNNQEVCDVPSNNVANPILGNLNIPIQDLLI